MQEPVKINLSNDPADARYTLLVTRLVDVINGCDTGIALSCLLSLYRACVIGKPSFHEGAKHYLQQILDELKALDGETAPAATPVPAGAPVASPQGYAIELSAEVADIVGELHLFVAGRAWPHNLLLPALLFIFHETAIANRCCLQTSAELLVEVSQALRQTIAAKPVSEAERAGQPIH